MDAALPPVDVGASIAYAAPVASAERGARVSDTTTGMVPLRLDAAYAFTPSIAVAAAAAYAPAIPTLCQSAGDCVSSLGSDVMLSLRVRARLPTLGPLTPRLDLGVGYEWLTTKLADGGATATRAYHGPVVALVEAQVPFRLGARWTLGPTLGAALGVFTHESLDTNAFQQSGAVPEHAAHAWLTLGVRLGFEPR